MAGFTIGTKHDLAELERDLGLVAAETMAAHVRASNRALTTVRKEAASALAPDLPGVRISAIKARIRLQRATRRQPAAALQFSSGRFRLYGHFATRQTTRGVPLRRGGPWRIETIDGQPVAPAVLAHAFIQRPRHGGVPQVFVRVGARRYPLTALYVPSLSAALIEKRLADVFATRGRDRYLVVLQQEAQYQLLTRRPSKLDD